MKPTQQEHVMNKAEQIIELLAANGVSLDEREQIALKNCFGVRGKYKGYLKAKAPAQSKHPLENAIYNAIQPNPYKVQIFNLMCMSEETRETYYKLSPFKYPAWLDLDKEQLQALNAW